MVLQGNNMVPKVNGHKKRGIKRKYKVFSFYFSFKK